LAIFRIPLVQNFKRQIERAPDDLIGGEATVLPERDISESHVSSNELGMGIYGDHWGWEV
jgi:hypothetical protein